MSPASKLDGAARSIMPTSQARCLNSNDQVKYGIAKRMSYDEIREWSAELMPIAHSAPFAGPPINVGLIFLLVFAPGTPGGALGRLVAIGGVISTMWGYPGLFFGSSRAHLPPFFYEVW